MAADVADWTQAVNVTGGSVSISGTATVTISGTPTVQFAAGQSVSISGTPSVTIASGSVSISGTPNINLQSQSVTINVNSPGTALANLVFPAGGNTTLTTGTVPAGTHALALDFAFASGQMTLTGHQSGAQYWPADAAVAAVFAKLNERVVIAVDPAQDTTFDLKEVGTQAGTVHVTAILDTQAVSVFNTPIQPVYVGNDLNQGQNALVVASEPFEGTRNSYSYVAAFSPAATPTDVFEVLGSASQQIRVTRITVEGTLTTAAFAAVNLIHRSTANTGGTKNAVTASKHNLANPAAVAQVSSYSVNPTGLGSGTTVRGAKMWCPTPTGGPLDRIVWTFGDRPSQAIGPLQLNESLEVNFGGATLTGLALLITVETTEAPFNVLP